MPEESKPNAKTDLKDQSKPQRPDQGKESAASNLLKKSEIALWLDHYDDIFSDFDPRPYSLRAISDDFLKEARKAAREFRPGLFELRFLVPANHRKPDHEAMIKKRLREHFKKHADMEKKAVKDMVRRGVWLSLAGIALMVGAASAAYFHKDAFIWTLVVVIMEPAGWFTVWNGLDRVFFRPQELEPEKAFYEKMSKAEIRFDEY